MTNLARRRWLRVLAPWRRRRLDYLDARDAGDAARDRRNWREAADYYQAALELDDSALDIAVQLGHAYKEMGLYDSAAEQYDRRLKSSPMDDDIYLQIGHLEKLRGNIGSALKHYHKSAILNENNKEAIREYEELSGRALIPAAVETSSSGSRFTSNPKAPRFASLQFRPSSLVGVDVSKPQQSAFLSQIAEIKQKLDTRLWG